MFRIFEMFILILQPKIYQEEIDMAKKSKDQRVQVILECTEHKASGLPGMSRYITTKNKKNTPERLELKKYNPVLKKMTVHKEIK
jgi:large subunit ribosomal protein L33